MEEKKSNPIKTYRAFSYKKKIRIVVSLILVIILMYGIAIAFLNSTGPIQTSTVTYDDQNVRLNVMGFAARDESDVSQNATNNRSPLIKLSKGQSIGLTVNDGDYVSYNQDIARVFSTKEAYESYRKYTELKAELEIIERLANYTSKGSDLDAINLEITSLLRKYVDQISSSEVTAEFVSTLQNLAYQIDTKSPDINVEKTIASLNKKLAELKLGITSSKVITSPSAGYFSNEVDGFEGSVDFSDVMQNGMSVPKLKKLLKKTAESDESYLGKIVFQNNWYFSFLASKGFAGEFLKRGSYITVDFPAHDINGLTMVVSNKISKGDDVCVTCRCSIVTPQILHLRIENAVINARNIKGFKVSNNAIVTIDGVNGVYVAVANRAVFKPVNIVYASEDYSIVRSLTGVSFVKSYGTEKFYSLISDITKSLYKADIKKYSDYDIAILDYEDDGSSDITETEPSDAEDVSGESTSAAETEIETTTKPDDNLEPLTIETTEPPEPEDDDEQLTTEAETDAAEENTAKKKANLEYYFNKLYNYDERRLSDYDITIVKGRNIEDGKFIN